MRKKEHSVEVEKGLWCEKHARTHSHKQHKILTGAALAHTQRFSHAIAGGRIRSCSWKKDYSRARGVCPFFSSTPTLCVAGNIGNCGFTTVCVCSCSRQNVYDCVNSPPARYRRRSSKDYSTPAESGVNMCALAEVL